MLDLLLSISSDAILIFNAAGLITLANKSAESIFMYSPGELVGKPLERLLPDRYIPSHTVHFKEFLESADNQRRMGEYRNLKGRRKDGTEFPLEASIGKGELKGEIAAVVTLRDISDRIALREESELSSVVLGTIGNLVLVSNSAGKIVYVNPLVKMLIGYEPAELLGEGWWDLERLSGWDIRSERAYVMDAASGKVKVDGLPYEHRLKHKDGSWRVLMLADAKGPGDLL
ncbi:MAG: PAS domain-containing protein, partial [Bacteroidales bacterium]